MNNYICTYNPDSQKVCISFPNVPPYCFTRTEIEKLIEAQDFFTPVYRAALIVFPQLTNDRKRI